MFDMLTDDELRQLDDRAYRGCMRLYDAANGIHDKMMALPTTLGGEWKNLQRAAGVIMAAAREQNEMCAAICREMRERREANQASPAHNAAVAAEIVADWAGNA